VHEWVDHTGEVELHVRAASREELFAEAAVALADLLGEDVQGDPVARAVEVRAADDAALLADWLGELVWLAESEQLVPACVLALDVAGGVARGTVELRRARRRDLVKAVTYHRLTCAQVGDGWQATVVLDV
jgi:SHS2 domain-containing protein